MTGCRVLVIHSAADLYGASLNLVRSLQAFERLGWQTFTILPYEGPLVEKIRASGYEVSVLDHGVLRRQNLNPRGILRLMGQNSTAFRKLGKLIKEEKIDLIYTNSNANIIGGMLALWYRKPHIWHIHEIIQRPAWFKYLLEFYIRLSGDQVLCVSQAVKDNFSLVRRDRLKLLYNGIDLSPFADKNYNLKKEIGISRQKTLIGMVARVSHWKGQFYFLEMADILVKKYPDIHFVMVGDAFAGYEYLYDDIRAAIKEKNLEGLVSDLGYRTDIPEILDGLDLFVLPSILPDPLPTTVLEAMAAGKPVIATAHGGAVEMVDDGSTGYLIPWDDAHQAVNLMEELITNQALRVEMGNKGRERVNSLFNMDLYIQNFCNIVAEVRQ